MSQNVEQMVNTLLYRSPKKEVISVEYIKNNKEIEMLKEVTFPKTVNLDSIEYLDTGFDNKSCYMLYDSAGINRFNERKSFNRRKSPVYYALYVLNMSPTPNNVKGIIGKEENGKEVRRIATVAIDEENQSKLNKLFDGLKKKNNLPSNAHFYPKRIG